MRTEAARASAITVPHSRFRSLPTPQRDRALYRATLAAGFAAYPEREQNYRRFQAAERGERLDYLPIQLDIENVSRCNFRCTMCQVSDWPKMQRAGDMSFEDYKALLDEQYGVIDVKLQGMGEPMLAGETYFRMIEYARARHLWVRSTVNGSLLHLRENYKRLIDSDISETQISIDGATEATFEKIRRGGKFKRVMANTALLNAYARDAGRLRTRLWAVVQKDNFDELELFPKLAADHGFERLTLSINLNDWGQARWREVNDTVDMTTDFEVPRAERLLELGRRHGVEVTFWCVDERYDPAVPEKLCPWPFERLYVASDMRAVPCCVIANPDTYDLGDARRLSRVWHSDAMVEFRRAHLEGRIPEVCLSCYQDRSAVG